MKNALKFLNNIAPSNFFQHVFNSNIAISDCDCKKVGKHSGVSHAWTTSPQNPLLNLHANRIYYILEGSAKVVHTKGELEIHAGNVYLLPANTILYTSCKDAMVQYFIHFVFDESLNNSLNHIGFRESYPADDHTYRYFESVRDKYLSSNADDILTCQAYLRLLLAPFFINAKIENINFFKFNNVIQYINDHYAETIEVSQLSNIIGYNTAYFCRIFYETFKVAPKQYILKTRIDKAKYFLLSSDLQISEIANNCGFNDQLYFSRLFKKYTNASPTQYRAAYRKEHVSVL